MIVGVNGQALDTISAGLKEAGARLELRDGKLIGVDPAGGMTTALKKAIKEHRDRLKAHLQIEEVLGRERAWSTELRARLWAGGSEDLRAAARQNLLVAESCYEANDFPGCEAALKSFWSVMCDLASSAGVEVVAVAIHPAGAERKIE